jgi:hypothetical protein
MGSHPIWQSWTDTEVNISNRKWRTQPGFFPATDNEIGANILQAQWLFPRHVGAQIQDVVVSDLMLSRRCVPRFVYATN